MEIYKNTHRDRGAARNDGLDLVPTPADAAAVALNQLLEGDRHLLLHYDRVVYVPRDRKQLGLCKGEEEREKGKW